MRSPEQVGREIAERVFGPADWNCMVVNDEQGDPPTKEHIDLAECIRVAIVEGNNDLLERARKAEADDLHNRRLLHAVNIAAQYHIKAGYQIGVKAMHEEFEKRGAKLDQDLWPKYR